MDTLLILHKITQFETFLRFKANDIFQNFTS